MTSNSSTYQLKLFRNFKAIEPNAYHTIVRYYEEYKNEIHNLEFDAFFEIFVSYVSALFEAGEYEKHINEVDQVIELSIEKNIHFYNGVDIFLEMLFKKSASSFNLKDYSQAKHIVQELLRINPANDLYIAFYKKILRKENDFILRHAKAIGVFFILSGLMIVGIELLMIDPFYADLAHTFSILRMAVFSLALVSIIFGEVFQQVRINQQVKNFLSGKK